MDNHLAEAKKALDVLNNLEPEEGLITKIKKMIKEYMEISYAVSEKKKMIFEALTSLVHLTGKSNYFLPAGGYYLSIAANGDYCISGARGNDSEQINGRYSALKFIQWISPHNFADLCNNMLSDIVQYLNTHINVQEINETGLFVKRLVELSEKVKQLR